MSRHKQMNNHHSLNTKWTLWEHRSKDSDDDSWMDQFYPVATVDTVEKLWLLWGHYPKPSTLFAGSKPDDSPPLLKRDGRTSRVLGLCVFKDPIPPETRAKDDAGVAFTGLRSILEIDTNHGGLKSYDDVWTNLVLTLLGEEVVSSSDLNGVWLANRTRKGFLTTSIRLRLELWWASHLDEAQVDALKNKLVHALNHKELRTGWRIR